jgi:ABC-type transporter Mla subunit MlaD
VITRRIVINLIVFSLLAIALIAYGFFDLLGNPLAKTTTISAVFPSASGLAPNFLVTLNGVDVGTVKSVSLVPGGAKVTMELNQGTKVPSDVQASVVIANTLGEQEVDLTPRPGAAADPSMDSSTGSSAGSTTDASSGNADRANNAGNPTKKTDPPGIIQNGATVPAAANSEPASIGTLVAQATKLLQSIPAGNLNLLLQETATALNGNSQNLKTIASSSELFSQEFLAQQQQFEDLLSNAPPVLNTVTQNAAALQQGLQDTAVLVQVLATHASDLVRLFDEGVDASNALNELVTQNEPNLGCFLHDDADLSSNLGSAPNLQNLSTVLTTNQLFFGAIHKLAVTGPAKALNSGDQNRSNQEWLRTHLLIPGLQVPLQPAAMEYSTPTVLPAVRPGAGCNTEFGNGVGPVSQAGFHPVGPNARVVPPSPAQSNVRGGGTEPAPGAPASARARYSNSGAAMPILVGIFLLGWFVALGHRRSTRSARPVRKVGDRSRPVRKRQRP